MRVFGLPLVLALTCAPLPAQARDLVVFAAASLKNVLDEATDAFEHESGIGVALSYAGSSALARQIEQGAPADIFISANIAWIDHLAEKALIDLDSHIVLAGNRLVLIGQKAGPVDLTRPDSLTDQLGADDRLAMALFAAVPAGIYGKAALENLGLWSAVAPSVAQTDNVRAALRLVSLGEARMGIVYATDAAIETSVDVLAQFPEDSHPPIRYPAVRVADSVHDDADALLNFLISPPAQAIFASHGFLPGPSP